MELFVMSDIIDEAIEDIKFRLADNMIDVELEEPDYKIALRQTAKLYLQRAENATYPAMVLFNATIGQQVYDLKSLNIQRIHAIYRNNIGAAPTEGSMFDPFSVMFQNQFLSNSGGNGLGGLSVIHMQHMHRNLVQTMMANEVQFMFNNSTKELTLMKAMRREERLLLHCELKRSIEELLDDSDINPWFISYATALCKQTLGIAYSKFQTLASPNGGVSLGGDALRQEGKEEQTALEEQLARLITSTQGYPFTVG